MHLLQRRATVCLLASQPCPSRRPLATPPPPTDERLKQCYRLLNVPQGSTQETVRTAFLKLAKKYHPDSGSADASIDKFCEVEYAFRLLTEKHTRSTAELENMEFNFEHTVPQHRQYLNLDGVGHGTPVQRQKQYMQVRAQTAAKNVMEHRISKASASENSLLKKEDMKKKHDIKTQYGFDRLVEDLIQEAMAKGEFDNLSGKGKPLKGQNYNPFVDFTTHKINEVLINNGCTPEWITLNKEIKEEIESMKQELRKERCRLGPEPLSDNETKIWNDVCEHYRRRAKKINSKITSFNLIVPLINKQMFLINFEEVAKGILQTGQFERNARPIEDKPRAKIRDNAILEIFRAINYIISMISGFVKKLKF